MWGSRRVVERLERPPAQVAVGVAHVGEQAVDGVGLDPSPSPASKGTSSVEVIWPNSVCQALTAAGLRSESIRSSGSESVWGAKRRSAIR